MEDLLLSPLAYNAHLLRGVIASTAPAAESPDEARTRAAAIIEMFKAMEPVTPLESLHACHCIALRLVLPGAIRAVASGHDDPRVHIRQQATLAALTRVTQTAEARYAKLQTRGEAQGAAAAEAAAKEEAKAEKSEKSPESAAPSSPALAEPPAPQPAMAMEKPGPQPPPMPPAFTAAPFTHARGAVFPAVIPRRAAGLMVREALLASTALSMGVERAMPGR